MAEYIDDTTISDEILSKAQKELAEFLDKNNIPKAQKMMLQMQSYLLMVMVSDHQKTSRMYPAFKEQQKRKAWWERLQWVVIPIVSAGVLTFLWQAVVFWFDIVPKLGVLK